MLYFSFFLPLSFILLEILVFLFFLSHVFGDLMNYFKNVVLNNYGNIFLSGVVVLCPRSPQ